MIPRYTHPEMGRIWSDERRYETWLQVELAAAEAMADAGHHSAGGRARAEAKARFDIARIEEIEKITQHDVIAFTTAVAEQVGPSARWLHFGLTSSDVVDTAQALQMREACDVILEDLDGTGRGAGACVRASAHADDRPHARRARRADDVRSQAGALVRRAHARRRARAARARDRSRREDLRRRRHVRAPRSVDRSCEVCRRLGLEPAPISSQVIQRDRHAELLSRWRITAASLEKFALEIRGLQKTEIGEVEEPFGKGQKGSSAMPHKRNPIGCEQIVGLARLMRANAMAALENVALWHERDISHSSVERVILPDSFIVLDHMLRRFTRIVTGLVVYPDRMRENLERSRGVIFSGQVLLELARRGVSREQAYEWVQRNAMRSFDEQKDFKTLLLADANVMGVLARGEVEKAFDLNEQLRNVDAIFERVFAEKGRPSRPTLAAGVGGMGCGLGSTSR